MNSPGGRGGRRGGAEGEGKGASTEKGGGIGELKGQEGLLGARGANVAQKHNRVNESKTCHMTVAN